MDGLRVPMQYEKPRDYLDLAAHNVCGVSPTDFPRAGKDMFHIAVANPRGSESVLPARCISGISPRRIFISEPQRGWTGISQTDVIGVRQYNHGREGQGVLASVDITLEFYKVRDKTDHEFKADELVPAFLSLFDKQVMAPGQEILFQTPKASLRAIVTSVQPLNLLDGDGESRATSDPRVRAMLTSDTKINFVPNGLKLAASLTQSKKLFNQQTFNWEAIGIGGLDKEFSIILRRAFASRVYPPKLIQEMGLMHVKGILLYGPPGTGKTLIARRIGQMLNAKPPKVINGPEILNKYVGQSEENVRKLFAEAEKEYKEKGDASELHIIIFDELDAVCKQRGSGAGGGTGVGDSVVNQLLSKLDGVDQLNNILLIGMTNRRDMIDEALLRPGRLEVQVEIGLADERGRQQILSIHTSSLRDAGRLGRDVDLGWLAASTPNYSGAELSGLVRSAVSYALNRHIKDGKLTVDSDNVTVGMDDFANALKEVEPAYGVAQDVLQRNVQFGIVHFSDSVKQIINECKLSVETIRSHPVMRLSTVLLHGPKGSGTTALAAHIAQNSGYPFVKMITPDNLVGYGTELARKDYLHKIFTDAYKTPLSMLIIDDIENLIDWNPVGPRFSLMILQTLVTLMRALPPKDRRLLIICTTSSRNVLQQLEVTRHFSRQIAVPAVRSYEELKDIVKARNADRFFGSQSVSSEEVIWRLAQQTGRRQVGVGVKLIMEALAESEIASEPATNFINEISRLMAEMSPEEVNVSREVRVSK